MPFKSQAQRRKFYAMENSGEISTETLNKWRGETPKGKKLPERVKKGQAEMLKAARMNPLLRNALTGGAIGAGTGGLFGYAAAPKKHKTRNAISGAVSGGLWGAVLGADATPHRARPGGHRPGGGYRPRQGPVKTPSWAKGTKTKVDAKKKFRAQAMKNHPDRGGSTQRMQDLNNEWDTFKNSPAFSKLSTAFFDELNKIAMVRQAKQTG